MREDISGGVEVDAALGPRRGERAPMCKRRYRAARGGPGEEDTAALGPRRGALGGEGAP